MASESSIIDTEEGETEQIASGTHIVDIRDILKREIKEEAIEFKSFSERGLSNECLEKHSGENTNFNDFIGELAKPKVNHFDNGIIIKNEDGIHSDCTEDLSASAELKTETFKTEYGIDTVYEDVKLQLCAENSSGKNENESYLNYVTDQLESTYSRELSKDSKIWHQQSIQEDGTAAKRTNSEKESTIQIDSKNSQMIQELPHCKYYPNVYPFECKKPFQCKICSKSFSRKDHLMGHEIIHTGEKPFQCKVCPKGFARKYSLVIHERIHTGEKPFQCKVCPKNYVVERRLLLHEKSHTGEKPFRCRICPKGFARNYSLLIHETIHTGEKQFQCKVCPKSFAVKRRLLLHEKIHTGKKPFQCKICSKSFYRKEHLMRHEVIHTGEKPFQCKVCPKSFARKCALLIHETIHTGEKQFQCKVCPKSFALKRRLSLHEKIHTGEKPFQCKVCPKSFVLKNALLLHETIHTGKKPFQCKVCPKSFAVKRRLLHHEKIHTGENLAKFVQTVLHSKTHC